MWFYLFRYHRRLLLAGGLGFFLFFNYYGSLPVHNLRHFMINSRDAVKLARESRGSQTNTAVNARAVCTFTADKKGRLAFSADSLKSTPIPTDAWNVTFLDSTQTASGRIFIRPDGKILNHQQFKSVKTSPEPSIVSRTIFRLHYFEIAVWLLLAGAAIWLMLRNTPALSRSNGPERRLFSIVTASFLIFGLNKTLQVPLAGNPLFDTTFWTQIGLSLFSGIILTGTYFSIRNYSSQPEQLTSTETVLQGQWLNRTTALAFARGFLAAGILLGIVSAAYWLNMRLATPIFAFSNFIRPLTAPSPWTAIISSSLKQSILVGMGLLIVRYFTRKVLSEKMQLVTGILFLTLIHVSQLSLSPVWARVLLDLVLAVFMLFFFRNTDLLAGIIALFSFYAAVQAYPLMNTGNTFLAINGVSALILTFLPLLAALRGFRRHSFVMPINWPVNPKNSH